MSYCILWVWFPEKREDSFRGIGFFMQCPRSYFIPFNKAKLQLQRKNTVWGKWWHSSITFALLKCYCCCALGPMRQWREWGANSTLADKYFQTNCFCSVAHKYLRKINEHWEQPAASQLSSIVEWLFLPNDIHNKGDFYFRRGIDCKSLFFRFLRNG